MGKGKKGRGRERLEICDICSSMIPRNRLISFEKTMVFSTELDDEEENVKTYSKIQQNYCPKCAKRLRIYEKIKKQKERKRKIDDM